MPEKAKKLRVAMLGHKRIPSREGGVEIVVSQLASRIILRGHSVVCYNRKGNHVSGKEFNAEFSKEFSGVKLIN